MRWPAVASGWPKLAFGVHTFVVVFTTTPNVNVWPEVNRGPMSVAYNLSPMATLHPFRALRPRASDAARIAAVPYDVVSTDEARALADGNPLSFLRVSRAELELPAGTDPYSDAVYERAAANFDALKKNAL